MAGNLGNRRDVAEIREISEILKFRTGYGLVSYPSFKSLIDTHMIGHR